jgi:hypothetical protein
MSAKRANSTKRVGSPKPEKRGERVPIMSPEEERFMAFEGLVQWTRAVGVQAARVAEAQKHLSSTDPIARRLGTGSFQTECNYFAIAANKLLEFKEWALSFGLCATVDFSEVDAFSRQDIKDLRDMREHVLDYFKGVGRFKDRWIAETPEYSADASAFSGPAIGGRLDWFAFGAAAQRLLPRLLAEPIPFSSLPNMPPPPKPALPLRLYKSLDVLFGGNTAAILMWMSSPNKELGCIPIEKTRSGSIEALCEVVVYLEALISRRNGKPPESSVND